LDVNSVGLLGFESDGLECRLAEQAKNLFLSLFQMVE
jgi:hypothetical protein